MPALITVMLTRWTILSLLLFHSTLLCAQIDRAKFRSLSDESQSNYANPYLGKNWKEFYNPKTKPGLVADYKELLANAKGPKTTCVVRFFWHRNQLQFDLVHANSVLAKQTIDDIEWLLTYAHKYQPDCAIEEAIFRMAWCIDVLVPEGNPDSRARRIRVYDAALQSLNVLEKQPDAALHRYHSIYDINYHLLWMSTYFFRIEEYELARRATLLGYRLIQHVAKDEDKKELGYYHYKWMHAINLGTYYLHKGRLAEAMSWYQKAYFFGKQQPSELRMAVAEGYQGQVLQKQGKPGLAIKPLKRAVAVSNLANDNESEYNAIGPLIDAYLAAGQYEAALPVLQRALTLYKPLKFSKFIGIVDSTGMSALFAGLGEVYQYRGELKQALYYTQLANRLEVKRRQNDDARIFRQKQEKLEAEAYRAKLDQIDTDRQWAVWLRNALAASLGLALIGFLLYVYYQRRQRHEAEQQLALLAEQARANTAQLAELQQRQNNAAVLIPDVPLPNLNELMQSAILTDTDWIRFRRLFERVYPDYLFRLRATFPTLTPAEIRIVCLSRLNLSTKEMANMLGVSADTIVKTRYRIRKKANLPEGADLLQAFANV